MTLFRHDRILADNSCSSLLVYGLFFSLLGLKCKIGDNEMFVVIGKVRNI